MAPRPTTLGRRLRTPIMLVAALSLVAAACGDDDDDAGDDDATPVETAGADTTAAADDGDTTEPADDGGDTTEPTDDGGGGGAGILQRDADGNSTCGLGTGEPASGEPIKIGAINTNQPGVDFTWISKTAAGYFECVNDNGGINGRPIEYIREEEQTDPQQIASLASKLIETDQVVGLVGSTSLIECAVNRDYYAEQDYYLIVAGVAQDCFTSPNFSAVNMGPYYSSLGGAQAAVRAGAEGTLVVASPNQPGFDLINSGVVEFAEENGMTGVSILEEVPINDPAGLAQRLVQEAGEGGGVVLDFTGPTVLPLLQAIEQQGLTDTVVWASSTPPNDPSVAAALGPEWNDKFLINAEFQVLDADTPDATHLREVLEEYVSDVPLSSFAQMGYLAARIATEALLGIDGDITKDSVNDAFRAITNFESDIFCAPWYYESGTGFNVSNNIDLTVVPRDGVMVQVEDCFPIAELPGNQLAEIRAAEQAGGLNTGG